MQNSIPIAARSEPFFLAACLLATVVQSERIALAPGIDRLPATAGIETQVDFVGSNWNVQEMTDDRLADFFPDDNSESLTTLLLENEDFMECFKANKKESLRQICADSGGYFVVSEASLSCDYVDEETGETLVTNIFGFSKCYANTKACKRSDQAVSMSSIDNQCDNIIDSLTQSKSKSDPYVNGIPPATTSAGAGYHWSFDYLVLSGMVVGASFF
jgi:hypothetical protein